MTKQSTPGISGLIVDTVAEIKEIGLVEFIRQFNARGRKTFEVFDWGASSCDDALEESRKPAPIEQSHVISSELEDSEYHKPVIDIDVPIRVFPSTTPGHFHLYIDYNIKWDDYVHLLDAMARAGIVERGYVDASIERGGTHVRLPWIAKETVKVEEVPFP